MSRNDRRDKLASLLFGLTDKNVEFRNKWRSIAIVLTWFLLSGAAMILNVFFAQENMHKFIVIGMSFIKYIPLLIVVYNLARKMAAQYLDDIYELHDEDLASDFLEEVTFGYGHERITIREGKIPAGDERSSIILIGGPGSIQVNLDNVALLEKVDGEPEIIHPRNEPWKLGRFERIREIGRHDEVGKREYAIINLRDQFVSGLPVKSRTKDGIPLEAQGIKIIFSILRRQDNESDQDENDAYLFDEKAVRALVYNQALITPEPSGAIGIPFPWDTTVVPLVVSELENLITSHTLNEILASISQKETDQIANNEETIAQMRVEMTGAQTQASDKKEARPPNFESRSKITAQFFSPEFKKKAASIGVAIDWIDIGAWYLPNDLILDNHKEAWNLARENAKKRGAFERSKKKHEMEELLQLIGDIIIANYEKTTSISKLSNKEKKELEQMIAASPDVVDPLFAYQLITEHATNKKDARTIAVEILKAFHKELLAARLLIQNENKPEFEKQIDLERIEKALHDVSHLTYHYVKHTP
ncbi:MAG: hypothetical protein AABZ00_04920 [Chloroflexota bacterium]